MRCNCRSLDICMRRKAYCTPQKHFMYDDDGYSPLWNLNTLNCPRKVIENNPLGVKT